MAGDFIAADTVLAGYEKPNRQHPFVHAERGILEDAGNLDGELFLATFAEPKTASADIGVLFRSAARAFDTVRPTEFGSELVSAVNI